MTKRYVSYTPEPGVSEAEAGQMLTVDQVAKTLQVSTDIVRRWCRTGELSAIALGYRAGYRIRQDDLEWFLAKRSNETGAHRRREPVAS
jgi:excisionase family DNA binding protein